MTRDQLVAALQAQGFDYLSAAEAQDYVHQAVMETHLAELWPYRLTTAVVATNVPLAGLTELTNVEDVTWGADSKPLRDAGSRQALRSRYGVIGTVGDPVWYWMEGATAAGVAGPVVQTYPVIASTDRVTVRFYQSNAPWVTGAGDPTLPANGGDSPLFPVRRHRDILLKARQLAYEETDEDDSADRMSLRWQKKIDEARLEMITGRVRGRRYVGFSGSLV